MRELLLVLVLVRRPRLVNHIRRRGRARRARRTGPKPPRSNLREKTDPIFTKIVGGEQQIREGAMKRAEIRDVVGSKLMREITLK